MIGPQPDEPEVVVEPDLTGVAEAVAALGCPFVTTDLAQRTDGPGVLSRWATARSRLPPRRRRRTAPARAQILGLAALAITDHDELYAVPELAAAAAEHDIATVFGAELNLAMAGPRRGQADPAGKHLVVLARGPAGYGRLSAAITEAKLAGGEKDLPAYDVDALAEDAQAGHWQIHTGGRKGPLGRALDAGGWDQADIRLADLVDRFGASNLAVEVQFPSQPRDAERVDALAALAARHGLPVAATTGAHYARPERAPVAAVRAHRSLEGMDPFLARVRVRASARRGGDVVAVPRLPRSGRGRRPDRQ
jgi:error-prone DNA polymerase